MHVIRSVVGVALLTAGAAALPAGTGQAQQLSEGCTTLNNPVLDSNYIDSVVTDQQFLTGDTASFRVGAPVGDGPAPTATQVLVNGAVVTSGAFPATLLYIVPADGTYTIEWRVNVENTATWNVSCGPPGIGSSDGGDLADTGPASPTVAVMAGVLFVAAGSSLFLVSHKRQRTHSG